MRIERHPRQNGVLVRLRGPIDDKFDRIDFARDLRGVVVVFNLDDVREVTSAGVNEWLRAIADAKAAYAAFLRCRPAVVSRFNDVPGFGGGGQIISFYLPYECPRCRTTFQTLHDMRRPHAWVGALAPPPANCPACHRPALFDGLPEMYLAYLAKAATPDPPALAEELIEEAEARERRIAAAAAKKAAQKAAGGQKKAEGAEGRTT